MKLPEYPAYGWTEIDRAPEAAGIYAWYAHLNISTADVDAAVQTIGSTSGTQKATEVAEAFLMRFVYSPFRETPYQVDLRGPLKPKYSGPVDHEPQSSQALVERIGENPERLRLIAKLLRTAAPAFTAPLYIGMAANLRVRLKQHKAKIVELRDRLSVQDVRPDDGAIAGFAHQIAARGFDPTSLFVVVAEVEGSEAESKIYNDLENVLNRINYPIFGRN